MFYDKEIDVEIAEGELVFFNHKMIGFYNLVYPDYEYVYQLAQNHMFFPTEDHFGILLALIVHGTDDIYTMADSDSLAVWNCLYSIAVNDFRQVNAVERKAQCLEELLLDQIVLQRSAQKLAQLL